MNLVTVSIPVGHNGEISHLLVTGELVRPGLAITPAFAHGGLAGTFTLTHVESGYALHSEGEACVRCVRAFVESMPEFDFDRPGYEVKDAEGGPEMAELLRAACARCRSVCAPMVDALFDVASQS